MQLNIRPEVSILGVLKHLNYRPWFALAEYVDNSINSFLQNRDALRELGCERVTVAIELDQSDTGRLTIRDDAAGIHTRDLARAFRPAEVPPDRTGLSEFGMGMKSASCWLANNWSVRTSSPEESLEHSVSFDVSSIVDSKIDSLAVHTTTARRTAHFTEIALWNMNRVPQTKTISKIREHLTSIYRQYLRGNVLRLLFNGDELRFDEPEVLLAPWYREPQSAPLLWRKPIAFDLDDNKRVTGFAALRSRASTSDAGFALFRRDRLIQGSGDDGYRPTSVFGQSNSYRYQRLFGELHLEGFDVSHTKDGFRLEESEAQLLEELKGQLNAQPLPLLTQAEEYRVRAPRASYTTGARTATDHTAMVVAEHAPPVLQDELSARETGGDEPPAALQLSESTAASRVFSIELNDQTWTVQLEVVSDPAVGDWLSLSESPTDPTSRLLGVRMNAVHPFMDRFCGTDPERLEGFLRVGVGICLAEVVARMGGVRQAGAVRRNLNDLLKRALAEAV